MTALLDVMFALVLVGVTLLYALPQIAALSVQPAQNDAGNQIAIMQAAGSSYIKNHFNSLVGSIAVGGSSAVTPANLITDGDLPSGFSDFNVFGQKHVLVIAQPSSGVLDGMVFTYGGDTIQDMVAIRVAQAGPANAMVLLGSDPANFQGAAGGETVAVSEFSSAGYSVTPGHLAAHIEPAIYAAESPFLNRYYTGNADDNTMYADLTMNGHNIANAGTVSATKLSDPVNPNYQISPAGSSNVNSLSATNTLSAPAFVYPQ